MCQKIFVKAYWGCVVNTFMGYYTEDFVIILAKAQLNLKLLSHASFAFLCLLFVTDSDFIF